MNLINYRKVKEIVYALQNQEDLEKHQQQNQQKPTTVKVIKKNLKKYFDKLKISG